MSDGGRVAQCCDGAEFALRCEWSVVPVPEALESISQIARYLCLQAARDSDIRDQCVQAGSLLC